MQLGRKYTLMLLELYPGARHIICDWATENIQTLSSELIAHFVREELVQILYRIRSNKGLLQILWERGTINEAEVSKYRLEGGKV